MSDTDPNTSTTPSSDTMSAIMGSDAPSAPASGGDARQDNQAREEAADAQLLGMTAPDAATESAKDSAKAFREGGTPDGRDKAGRFTASGSASTATPRNADNARADEDAESDDAGEGAADTAKDADEEAGDESYDDLISLADRLDKVQVRDGAEGTEDPKDVTRRPAEVGSAAQPASSATAKKDDKKEPAADQDDDERPYTAEELKEILDTEGRSAEIQARQLNLRLKERREAREAQKRDDEARQRQSAEQQSVAHASETIDNVVIPTLTRFIERSPALEAVYGKKGTERGKFTKTQITAIMSIWDKAIDRMRKSEFDPSVAGKLTLEKALDITLAKEHAKELKQAKDVADRRNGVVVERHNRKTLAATGGGGGRRAGGDPQKELKGLIAGFRGSPR